MDELVQLMEQLRTHLPVSWEQFPDFPLYMDQVLSYMDRQVLRFEDDDGLTSAMVNNYTKAGLLPRAEGKKYNQEHLAYLTVICILKRVMSAKDMGVTLDKHMRMIPFKSTSGIIPVVPADVPDSEDLVPCELCPMQKTCPASKARRRNMAR